MTIAIFFLLLLLPTITAIGLQAVAMRVLAPAMGLQRPDFVYAAGLAARQMLLALFLLIVLRFMPTGLSVFFAVLGAVVITSLQCRNLYRTDFQKAALFVVGSLVCALAALALLVGLMSFGGMAVSGILDAIAKKHLG